MDAAVAKLAAAIGEPARARMLYCLMDGLARTGTELAVVGEVSPSTASVHLARLVEEGLVSVQVQGRHRYYGLAGAEVAQVLEGLNVLAAGVGKRKKFEPNTPDELRIARTCYDHVAGTLGVALHDRLWELKWLRKEGEGYGVTEAGQAGLTELGVDVETALRGRRRFAFGCLDWSERRVHLGGALGASLLEMALKRRWVTKELHCRALVVTSLGRREWRGRLGVMV